MKKLNLSAFVILLLASCCQSPQQRGIEAVALKCEYLEEPLGIDMEHPRFSWIIESTSNDILQTGYEILVSKGDRDFSKGSLTWEPGMVFSSNSVNVAYDGERLESQSTYYWKVRIRDQHGRESPWSGTASFHTGYLGGDALAGKWIMSGDKEMRSPLMRKAWDTENPVVSAHIYATAIGLYELYLNGKKVENRLFEPATTQFTERVLYSVYDVTGIIQDGENVIGIWMGEGQSAYTVPPDGRFHNINMRVPLFDRPMMRLEMKIRYGDGGEDIIATDESWRCHPSPLTFNNYFGGEDYDARLELPGWDAPGYDDAGWEPVISGSYGGKISAQLLPPVREGKRYEPLVTVGRDDKTTDYDFGTTIGGYWEIEVEGEAGAEVWIRGTEKCGSPSHQKPLTRENELYWESNHTGKYFYRDCWSIYTLKGEGREVYKPRFFYQGHRYVQVKVNDPGKVRIIRLNNIEVGNSLAATGDFQCSDEYLVRLHGNIVQTFKNNLIQGVPLSNPNSEKYGWTGDVHLFSETADYTYDMPAFWTKWLQDFPDAQQWIDAGGLIPVTVPELRVKRHIVSDVTWLAVYPFLLRQMYRHCQDSSLLAVHYGSLKKWLTHVLDVSEGYIANGIWGDHVIPGEDQESLGASRGMTRLLNTAYLYNIAGMMAEFATLTGSLEDASRYQELAHGIYKTFNMEFYQEEKGLYMESPSPEGYHYELTANLIPLQMDLVPDERKEKILGFVLDHIKSRDYRSYTGILGTKALVDVLQEAGELEFLYQIIRNTKYPGWGYTMEELGGSTLNQTWNGRGDFNHCMFGSIDEFFYNDLLGIKFDFPGVENRILITPYQPDDLTFAKGKANTVFGSVASGWERTSGGMAYSLDIPHNTLGVFNVPAVAGAYEMIINGEPIIREGRLVNPVAWIKDIQPGEDDLTIQLGSGKYELMINDL